MSFNTLDLLPHRPPIKLVDDIIAVVKNESITATRHLPENDPLFAGHFPGKPIFPGVLGVEALAQAATCLVLINEGRSEQDTLVYFMSIEHVKFRKMIVPGDKMELQVRQLKNRGQVYKFAGDVMVNGEVATEATFTAKWDVRP